MISKLARQTIDGWKKEGLDPSFDDIILINALGLKVERGVDMYDFSNLPRMAYLGDLVFYEPTVAKQIWIDTVSYELNIDRIKLLLFALNCNDSELPDPRNIKELKKIVYDFYYDNIIQFTESQVYTLLDYLYFGDDPTEKEDYKIDLKKEEDFRKIHDIPEEVKSVALQLFNQAMNLGMDKCVKMNTLSVLERMITVAMARQNNADFSSNERAQYAGKFYIACDEIHDRLIKEKQDKETNKVN